MISTEKLSEVFVEVADTLVDDFDLIDFLHNLTDHASEICDALAAGIMLADQHGKLQYMTASNKQAQLVELFQLQHSEGPCFDCFHTGQAVVVADLSSAGQKWPTFAPRALQAGFSSVHAIPMRLRKETIGTLNIFGSATGHFDEAHIRIVQALADVATIAILQERSVERAETLTEQLQGALNSRITIEQAKGVLSTLLSVDTEKAFSLMRSHARQTNQRLVDVATMMINDPESAPHLTAPK